jgi:hypothetical protein
MDNQGISNVTTSRVGGLLVGVWSGAEYDRRGACLWGPNIFTWQPPFKQRARDAKEKEGVFQDAYWIAKY